MFFTQFVYKVVRVVAFGFKGVNFFLDIWQTWQFATGGSAVVVVTGLIAYLQNKPVWLIVALSIAAGILVVCVFSLIFKSYVFENTEGKRLKRLPKLVYDMHRRRCAVREGFVRKIDWDKVDSSKVVTPILSLLTKEGQGIAIDDDALIDIGSRFSETGGITDGPPLGFLTMMKSSDTDLEKALQKDFHHKVMQAKLDSYKPYPNETIRKDAEKVIHSSKIFNNVMVFQSYLSEPLSLESLSEDTQLSDVKKWQVYLVNANAGEIMDIGIDMACTKLSEHIEEYLRSKKRNK